MFTNIDRSGYQNIDTLSLFEKLTLDAIGIAGFGNGRFQIYLSKLTLSIRFSLQLIRRRLEKQMGSILRYNKRRIDEAVLFIFTYIRYEVCWPIPKEKAGPRYVDRISDQLEHHH